MPRKVKLSILWASSEDSKHPANELNNHGPTVRGWQSERGADFPQELVLHLQQRAHLDKIQVLVHQFLISEKLELWICDAEDSNCTSLANLHWEYLGYITLSDNQSTGFKSRELKSVSIPGCTATHLKIVLSKNHSNAYNIHNQVSLIAVNVLGDFLVDGEEICDYLSPYDDLAFEMYVDPEVADIIRDMEQKKYAAVKNERFEYARKLKQAMEQLREAGERLSKYELEKRHAIEIEDYERARRKKTQMEEFRKQIYAQLAVDRLLEANGVSSRNDEYTETDNNIALTVPKGSPAAEASPMHAARPRSPHVDASSSSPPTAVNSQRSGSFRRRNKSAGAIVKSSYEAYEERALPALRHSQTNEFLRECQLEPDSKMTSKLSEREKKQAALPIVVFGTDLVERFYSKQYSDKEEGLSRLRDELRMHSASSLHTANKTARAACFLLHRALRDKVFSVYSLANEVIRLLFVEFVPGRVSQAEVARSVDRLLPELLTKAGDQAARIHHMAVHTILTMAECPAVAELHQIPVQLSRPVSGSTHPRLALSRLEMVEQLIIARGISNDKQSGLTCRTLAECGVSGLHHPAEPVRKAAERVLVHVYRVNPRLVRKQLPPDDDITRRNLLYRQLFHEFDKIDVQRKQALLERNRLIQQLSVSSQQECVSPEPTPIQNPTPLANPINPVDDNADKVQNGDNAATSSSSVSGVSSPGSQDPGSGERRCIFCLGCIVGGSDAALNAHYWRRCPMLTRCVHCSQVVEVAALAAHLLSECERRGAFVQCGACADVVPVNALEKHVPLCHELPEGHVKCPLCRNTFEEGDSCWRSHLMGGEGGCSQNSRTKQENYVQAQARFRPSPHLSTPYR